MVKGKYEKSLIIHITLFVLIIVSVLNFVLSDSEKTQFLTEEYKSINTDWILNNGGIISVPYRYSAVRDKEFTIEKDLPSDIQDNMVLSITANYCKNYIYIDNELRYTYAQNDPLPYGRMYGNIQCVVPLTKEDARKSVLVKCIPQYTNVYTIPEIYYGYKISFLAYILNKNIWKVVVCAMLFAFSVISFSMSVREKKVRGRDNVVRMMQSYSLLAIFAILWLICSSDIPQFFTNDNEAVSFVSFVSLAFIAVPYSYFCTQVFVEGRKVFEMLYILGCVLSLIVTLGFVFNIVDPPRLLVFTHAYYGAVLVANGIFLIIEHKSNPLIVLLNKAILVLTTFVIAGLVLFYKYSAYSYDSIAFSIGFLVFTTMLLNITLAENEKMVKSHVRSGIYKELSYKDELTGHGNRAAYDNMINFIIANNENEEYVSLSFFDINYLGQYNKKYGNSVGDDLIIATSQCISGAFQNNGKIYRIGGDEFAVVVLGKQINTQNYLIEFDKCVKKYNEGHPMQLSVARGYAIELVVNLDHTNINSFLEKANKNMNTDKKIIKDLL